MIDPFSQVPQNEQEKVVEKTFYVPEEKNYILGIESRMFFGIFYGILIVLIFISFMAYVEEK